MTVFLRVLDPAVDEKAEALLKAVQAVRALDKVNEASVFERSPHAFHTVPGSPFAYWVSEPVRGIFNSKPRFESEGRTVKQGLATADDFRFLRNWWEVPGVRSPRWFGFAKGGAFSRFYADVYLCVNWSGAGAEIKSNLNAQGAVRSNVWMLRDTAVKYFARPGLTWPRRTQSGLGLRVLPAGCIFADKGPAAFVDGDDSDKLIALLAITTSAAFRYLVALQMAFGSYEVGVIQRTPIPNHSPADTIGLSRLARRAWSLKRSLDTHNEASYAFLLPAGLNETATGFERERAEKELVSIQDEIDDKVYCLYGIGSDDRSTIAGSSSNGVESFSETASGSESAGDEEDLSEPSAAATTDNLVAWLVGVAFGRFDPRLATGERAVPPEPEPFDPLPPRSPGMHPEGEEPADRPDILVDDEGHAKDLTAHVQRWAEHVGVDVSADLRSWLACEFFPLHIRMYSKSRRKAPIYWQLATPSASYSVWLYIHAFTKDTLFRVQNDYVAPKLAHEERQLETLRAEAGPDPVTAQRKAIEAQEAFVEELRTFLDEVKRVAPLWNTDLDDGVVINFAPLWRLVPQLKPWQKELKANWDSLCGAKYDWAHLAMYLWPERVVPKCADDRSLAIAHGLEDVFWYQDDNEKWKPREKPTKPIDALVKERTSAAVKAALKSLMEAPEQSGGVRRGRGRG